MATDSKAYGSPIVRPAEIADSRQAAELIYRTGEGLFKYLFYPDAKKTVALIRPLFEMENNDFSYQFAYVAELERQIAGLIVFMDRITLKRNSRKMGLKILKAMGIGPFLYRLPRFITAERLIPKLSDATLYINHIAVFKNFRGRGIANHLLDYCEKRARARELTRVALDVEVINDTAIQVYEKFGFKKLLKSESRTLHSNFGFKGLYRMQKEITG